MTPSPVPGLLQQIIKGTGVCIDSRQAKPGELFFALKGEHLDGNLFAMHAIRAGCSLAVIDDPRQKLDERFVLVKDSLQTLQELSKAYRELLNIPVLGITGTNGKTTTKELAHAVLSKGFCSFATPGNLNNHIGVPLSLLSIRPPVGVAIIEMGANHIGEIGALCEISKPMLGLVTNIGKAHLEGFGSVENIARAKTELYRYVSGQKGILFVNANDPRLLLLAGNNHNIYYGMGGKNHCSGSITASYPFLEVAFRVNKAFGLARQGQAGLIKSRLAGDVNFENIMAAATLGLYFGISPWQVSEAIGSYQPHNYRSQRIDTGKNTVLMDAYNAKPSSMAASLEYFSQTGKGPKAVILGDMLEMGSNAAKEHLSVLRLLESGDFQLRVLVGKHFSRLSKESPPGTHVFEDTGSTLEWLRVHAPQGYNILIKGSRGIRLEALLDAL